MGDSGTAKIKTRRKRKHPYRRLILISFGALLTIGLIFFLKVMREDKTPAAGEPNVGDAGVNF